MDPIGIDVERVTAVLLTDGWHYIQQRSFRIVPFAFMSGEDVVAKPQAGYFFDKVDQISRELQHFCGPIDCLLAVRYEVLTELATYDAEEADEDLDDEDD